MDTKQVTAIVTAICHPQKVAWLQQSILSLDKCGFTFSKKILSIDEFDGHKFPEHLKEKYESEGWTILKDNHHNRSLSLKRAIEESRTPFIFYNEDDILTLSMPEEIIQSILSKENKSCGMLSMTLGGSTFDAPNNQIGDFADIKHRVIYQDDKYVVFARDENLKGNFFFEFPALFVDSAIFGVCLLEAMDRHKGLPLEVGLTRSYFAQHSIDKMFFKASICKANIFDMIEKDPYAINDKCRLIKTLDPQQGNNAYGGNHLF